MCRNRYNAEQIIGMLRKTEVDLGQRADPHQAYLFQDNTY